MVFLDYDLYVYILFHSMSEIFILLYEEHLSCPVADRARNPAGGRAVEKIFVEGSYFFGRIREVYFSEKNPLRGGAKKNGKVSTKIFSKPLPHLEICRLKYFIMIFSRKMPIGEVRFVFLENPKIHYYLPHLGTVTKLRTEKTIFFGVTL